MEEFIQQLSNGLAVGGIYALIALGYTMVYGVLKLINFAHGDLFTLGSYLALTALLPLTLAGGHTMALHAAEIVACLMGLAAAFAIMARRNKQEGYLAGIGSTRTGRLVLCTVASIFIAFLSAKGLSWLFVPGLVERLGGVSAVVIAGGMAMGLVAILGFLLERTAYKPLRKSGRLSAVVSALGMSIFLQNALMLVYGAKPLVYPANILPLHTVNIAGAEIQVLRLGVCGVSFVLMCVLYWFIHKTRTGTAIRAAAIDRDVARLMGIDVSRVVSQVFMIGAGLGAVAGLMVGLSYGKISHDMGLIYGLKAFTAAILGGIGNIPGAMLGGLILGVVEAMGAAYISTAWKDAIAFVVLIAILVWRPTGILGERSADKL